MHAGFHLRFLEDLGAVGPEENGGRPLERISRVDFCIDFVSDGFQPRPENFIAHSRMSKQVLGTAAEVSFGMVAKGTRIESVRLGGMPRKQVVIYDKLREIGATSKAWWWDVWGLVRETFAGEIWRVEVRAGKDELDKWPIKRFAEFEARIGDVLAEIVRQVRYVVEVNDSNVSRWPNSALWIRVADAVADCLAPYSCRADPATVREVFRQRQTDLYLGMIRDLVPGLAVCLDKDISEIPDLGEIILHEIEAFAQAHPEQYRRKFNRAREKFVFISPPDT